MASSRSTFGPYVILDELGVGGMATVHRAELPGIEGFSKQVALKRMLPALADSEEGLSSFLREAQLASYLHHTNVALTYELGQIDGTYFIAMELINGHSLHDIMNRCAAMASPMPVAVACSLLGQILDALDYAHNLSDHSGQPLGIIHRDVSPSNVIVSDSGIAKLIDFGIAKASAAGMQTMNLTLKGKWAYMAPEYVETGDIDARADLFAVGVVAHELLVCRPLFSAADDVTTLTRLRTMEIPLPSRANPSVPRELDHVVMTALARNPDQRWQTASAMRSALAAACRQLALEVPPTEIARWLGDLFGTSAVFDDGAATIAGAPAYEDPAEVDLDATASLRAHNPRPDPDGRATSPVQSFNPAVLDLAATGQVPSYNPPQEELLELAPAPAPKTPSRTPAAASPVVPRQPTPAAASPVVPRQPTPAAASPVVPSRTATPAAASPVVPRQPTPAAASPVVPSPVGGNVPLDFDPPMPRTAVPPPPPNEFAAPEVSADARPLAQMLSSETTMGLAYHDPAPQSALPTPPPSTGPRKAPRAATGAEPLWDFGGLNIEPLRPRADAPTTAPVVVTVHDKKKKDREPRAPMSEGAKRTLIIAAAVLVTLGLAAAGYFLFLA